MEFDNGQVTFHSPWVAYQSGNHLSFLIISELVLITVVAVIFSLPTIGSNASVRRALDMHLIFCFKLKF